MILDVNLDPTLGSETGKIRPCIVVTNNIYNEILPIIQIVPLTAWNEKKALVKTNVEIIPTQENGLIKKSIADCLQTRPIDFEKRLINIRGTINEEEIKKIDDALMVVFGIKQVLKN
ncbi:MAG: type II toxin-antitoxin system PemK/MazF family toxin [Melioribacter sp.]|nr:type II toxin-antitoxin system PemK/MazF family toxin [Melioribacter sp.]